MTFLDEKLTLVRDRRSFIAFLEALALDRSLAEQQQLIAPPAPYGSGANGWEHSTISAFLDAAAAWAQVSDQADTANPWHACAEILLAGKEYE